MEQEVSHATHIAAGLILLAAFISIVMVTVYLGRDIEAFATDSISQIADDTSVAYFQDLIYGDTVLPTAAAYALIQQNLGYVKDVKCNVCGHDYLVQTGTNANGHPIMTPSNDNPGYCLKSHLTGKVSVEVTVDSDSLYTLKVHEEDCTWQSGVCTCTHKH